MNRLSDEHLTKLLDHYIGINTNWVHEDSIAGLTELQELRAKYKSSIEQRMRFCEKNEELLTEMAASAAEVESLRTWIREARSTLSLYLNVPFGTLENDTISGVKCQTMDMGKFKYPARICLASCPLKEK